MMKAIGSECRLLLPTPSSGPSSGHISLYKKHERRRSGQEGPKIVSGPPLSVGSSPHRQRWYSSHLRCSTSMLFHFDVGSNRFRQSIPLYLNKRIFELLGMHLFTQEIAKAYAYNYKTIAIQSTQSISKLVAGRVQTGQTCSASCPIPGEVHCERVKQPCTRHLGVQRLWQPVLVLRFYIKLIYIYICHPTVW